MIEQFRMWPKYLRDLLRPRPDDVELGRMSLERALYLTGSVVNAAMVTQGIKEGRAVLPDATLEEYAIANRVVAEYGNEQMRRPGTHRMHMTVADRGIAAHFALKGFWGDPEELLNALGYEINGTDD